jgi:hypothetical protein
VARKIKYAVDWRIEGTWEVEATSAEEAQKAFDKMWNSPRGIMPTRDGEASNDKPYPVSMNVDHRGH